MGDALLTDDQLRALTKLVNNADRDGVTLGALRRLLVTDKGAHEAEGHGGLGDFSAGEEAEEATERRLREGHFSKILLRCFVELLVLFIVAPAGIFLMLLPLGALLAWAEGWSWLTGVYYEVSIVCGLAQPLAGANNVSPSRIGTQLACSITGLWTLGLTGAIAALCGTYSESANLLKIACRKLVSLCCCISDDIAEHHSFGAWVVCTLLLAPVIILIFVCFCSGLMLALASGRGGGPVNFSDVMFYYLADVGGAHHFL